jgi:hypothetical protein
MKTIRTAAIAGVLALSLTACAAESGDDDTDDPTEQDDTNDEGESDGEDG